MKFHYFNKAAALTLLLVTAGLACWTFANMNLIGSRIDNNIFSLLPKSERNSVAEEFVSRVSKAGEQSAVVLIGSDILDNALAAEKEFRSQIKSLDLKSPALDNSLFQYIDILQKHKSRLITPEDIFQLNNQSPDFWYERSNALAYSLGGSAISWREDPFGLLGDWLNRLGGATKILPYGDSLVVNQGPISYVVVPLDLDASLGSIHEQNIVADNINAAIESTTIKFQGIKFLRSGVVFIASDTSKAAQKDISAIGLISAMAALILIGSIFRSFYAIGAVLLTVSIAFLYAFLACFFIFPKVYLLTLAFGTSLIGMSVDYCLYWLTGSIDDVKSPLARRRYLFPGMFLALLTTAMGYLLLAATPFPVLSQMAVFSISGIVASWLTVLCLFPYFSKLRFVSNKTNSMPLCIRPGFLSEYPFLRWLLIVATILISIYGAYSFRANDDIRSLASFNKTLVNEQLQVSKILDIPSSSQFFIVTGSSESQVLTLTEGLTKELDGLISTGYISGYQSVTQYVPSMAAQELAASAYDSLNKKVALKRVAKEMGMDSAWEKNQSLISAPLTISDLSTLPIYKKLSYLWFDSDPTIRSTAILLIGINGQSSVEQLSKLSTQDIMWIDKPQEISEIFHRYRTLFSYIIVAGYLLTFYIIYLKYKEDSWRAVMPPIFATFITLAVLTALGEPIGLLSVIAFALLLGVGTDYGIFLLQYPRDRKILFSISIAALMTLISFGSLSLSSVPALHGFGLTLFFGIFFSWLLTIFLARSPDSND
jgi:predicted exporter